MVTLEVLVEVTTRFHEDFLASGEGPLKYVPVPVQQDYPRFPGRNEAVQVHPAPAVKYVGQSFDALEAVAHGVRGGEERMLPNVDLHARVEQEGHDLPRRVT